jgi:predicted O-methyltransferase YrrM
MRRVISPSVSDVLKSSNNISTSATHALAKFFPETDETLLKQWANEYDDSIAGQYVQSESSELHSLYPTEWAVAQETAFFLYLLVRLRRPSLVVETGVANGLSSTSILLALAKNGHGCLVSIDVDENVGSLVPEILRDRWHLEVLPKDRSQREALVDFFNSLDPIDIFLHDSDHSYDWQSFEYEVARSHLTPEGLILSDDIDWSFAFIDFCQTYQFRPSYLISSGKIFGVACNGKDMRLNRAGKVGE